MLIRMVGHACIILYTDAGGILCDPWLKGKAFNGSWSMRPEPAFDDSLYDGIDYIWISHEHPDHFSVSTLREFDPAFKARVTVLFQKKNSNKLFDEMRKWGYTKFQGLPDRADVEIGKGVRISCHQVGMIDSILAVADTYHSVINLNDADVTESDLRRIRKQFGPVDLVLNQFSIAGFDGYRNVSEALGQSARSKLESMVEAHRMLNARQTLPFASFVYFSCIDNRFVNQHANSITDAVCALDEAGQQSVVLYPGETHIPGEKRDSRESIAKLHALHESVADAEYDSSPKIPVSALASAFEVFYSQLCSHYPRFLIARIGVIRWRLADHDKVVTTDFVRGEFKVESGGSDADIDVWSQPLHHGLVTPFGFETLAVSGRFIVQQNRRRWRMLKVISILYNQQVYLRPRYVLSRATLGYFWERFRHNLLGQVLLKRRQRRSMG